MPIADYKTALVTGASGGIGAATVERLCREGVTVHALARRADALADLAARTGCVPHAIDVNDLHAITRLAAETEFDILVNNAGVDRPGSILAADAEGIDLLVDVNLRAVLQLCRLVVPGMAARNRGHVVNISSIAAAYHFGGNTTYHATKAAVHMLSRQLRIDLLRQDGAGDGDLPGPGRDRHLHERARRHAGGAGEVPRRLPAAGGQGHRRRHRLRAAGAGWR